MQKEEKVQAFKNELKSYMQIKRDYNRLWENLIVVNQKINGISGPNYEGIRNQYNPFAPDPRTELFERKRDLDYKIGILYGRIQHVELTLSKMTIKDKNDIMDVYIYKKNILKIARKNNITERMQKYWMDKAIEKALFDTESTVS